MLVKTRLKKTQEIIHGENVPYPAPVQLNLDGEASFRPHPVDTETVILTIKSLKETSSVGSDGIPVKFINDALYVVAFYLTCKYFYCDRYCSHSLETRTGNTPF